MNRWLANENLLGMPPGSRPDKDGDGAFAG
ncbi:hypothetical protein GGD55_000837 [Rhizobium giardinii]|uniref:Uncharacterized protein n=1 Tax=Rhizobium giardinii TaxID=56731 RepID=A0A7W8U7A5_9HYPH|nr:hypothetical protein [Rhizobium giardinii]